MSTLKVFKADFGTGGRIKCPAQSLCGTSHWYHSRATFEKHFKAFHKSHTLTCTGYGKTENRNSPYYHKEEKIPAYYPEEAPTKTPAGKAGKTVVRETSDEHLKKRLLGLNLMQLTKDDFNGCRQMHGMISIIDAICGVTNYKPNKASDVWKAVLRQHPELLKETLEPSGFSTIENVQSGFSTIGNGENRDVETEPLSTQPRVAPVQSYFMPGRGAKTPFCHFGTLLQILSQVPGSVGKSLNREMATVTVGTLSKDKLFLEAMEERDKTLTSETKALLGAGFAQSIPASPTKSLEPSRKRQGDWDEDQDQEDSLSEARQSKTPRVEYVYTPSELHEFALETSPGLQMSKELVYNAWDSFGRPSLLGFMKELSEHWLSMKLNAAKAAMVAEDLVQHRDKTAVIRQQAEQDAQIKATQAEQEQEKLKQEKVKAEQEQEKLNQEKDRTASNQKLLVIQNEGEQRFQESRLQANGSKRANSSKSTLVIDDRQKLFARVYKNGVDAKCTVGGCSNYTCVYKCSIAVEPGYIAGDTDKLSVVCKAHAKSRDAVGDKTIEFKIPDTLLIPWVYQHGPETSVGACGLCYVTTIHVWDHNVQNCHLHPLSAGGTDSAENRVVGCAHCNQTQGSDSVDNFRNRASVPKKDAVKPYCLPDQMHLFRAQLITAQKKSIKRPASKRCCEVYKRIWGGQQTLKKFVVTPGLTGNLGTQAPA